MLADFLAMLRIGSSYKDKAARRGMYALALALLVVGIVLLLA